MHEPVKSPDLASSSHARICDGCRTFIPRGARHECKANGSHDGKVNSSHDRSYAIGKALEPYMLNRYPMPEAEPFLLMIGTCGPVIGEATIFENGAGRWVIFTVEHAA